MKTFRTFGLWRLCFFVFVVLVSVAYFAVAESVAVLLTGPAFVWGTLFFNLLSVVLSLFFGLIGFLKVRIGEGRIELRFPIFTKVIDRSQIVAWDRRSSATKFSVLFLGNRRTFALDTSVLEDEAEFLGELKAFLSGVPQAKSRHGHTFSPAWEWFVLFVLTAMGVSAGLAFGWVFVAVPFTVIVLGLYALWHHYRIESYCRDGYLYVGPNSYSLDRLKGVFTSPDLLEERGLIAVFGYDDVFVSARFGDFEEIKSDLSRALEENKKRKGFLPLSDSYLPSNYGLLLEFSDY